MLMQKIKKLLAILPVPAWRNALRQYGVAAGIEHAKVLRHLSAEGEVKTVVDVGANRGQFALVSRTTLPATQIYSFEPLQEPFDLLSGVMKDDNRFKAFLTAIGEEKTESVIHISQRDDSSSLLPITDNQDRLFPGTAEKTTRNIQVGRLSDYLTADDIAAPALMKIDVQGFELQVLAGSEDLIDRFQYVYVEASFVELYEGQALAPEVIDWLHAHQFKLSGIYHLAYDSDGKAIQADFLFTRG